jgi:hypothetical protein
MHTEFWCGNLKERHHFEDRCEDNIKMDLENIGWQGVE